MCKLNILCPSSDGNCSCSASTHLQLEPAKPCNSLLASILSHIKHQPEIMRVLENHSQPLLSEDSTQRSSSENQESPEPVSEQIFIEHLSGLKKSFQVRKKFSLMLCLIDRNGKNMKLEEKTRFKVELQNRESLEKVVLAEFQADSAIFAKGLIVEEEIRNADLVVYAERDDIVEFRKSVVIRNKDEGKCLKKAKLE